VEFSLEIQDIDPVPGPLRHVRLFPSMPHVRDITLSMPGFNVAQYLQVASGTVPEDLRSLRLKGCPLCLEDVLVRSLKRVKSREVFDKPGCIGCGSVVLHKGQLEQVLKDI